MPNALVEKCCTPCRGIPPPTLDEAQRYLGQDTPDAPASSASTAAW